MKKILKKFAVLSFLFVAVIVWTLPSWALDDLHVEVRPEGARMSFLALSETQVLASVVNEEGDAVLGLGMDDFTITKGPKTAQILSVEAVPEPKDVGLNIVLVVDNSFSMRQRKAVEPLLAALDDFLSVVRPIDNVHIVTFVDPRGTAAGRQSGRDGQSYRVFRSSAPQLLGEALRTSFSSGMTDGTYLYDAMLQGLEIVRQMPERDQKFMVVFSDGEDINSTTRPEEVQRAARGIANFTAFTVDYLDRPGLDPLLQSFAEAHNGMIRKASRATDFLPIFKTFSTTIFHRYLVTFRFLDPPAGTISIEPQVVKIEETTIVDSSPLLNYLYFETGQSEIPPRYALFSSQAEAASFAEEKLTDTMEKYHHLLNVIGKRLAANPVARITITGCNADSGVEKGNLTLSRSRAEAVAAYLRYVWTIDPARIGIEARNLPAVPSTSRVEEGKAENQRVEIFSDHPAVMDTVKSIYVEEQTDAKIVRVHPEIRAEAGLARWRFTLLSGDKVLRTDEGEGDPPAEFAFDLEAFGLRRAAALGLIRAEIEAWDREGNVFSAWTSEPTRIDFIRREERIAQRLDYKVVEKYALILFDFDRAELKGRNEVIVNRLIARALEVPTALTHVVGHTDIIGKESYNLKLSERRAQAVFAAMVIAGIPPGSQLTYEGVGPANPPYDNGLPEGRALNRTVIITLQYMEKM